MKEKVVVELPDRCANLIDRVVFYSFHFEDPIGGQGVSVLGAIDFDPIAPACITKRHYQVVVTNFSSFEGLTPSFRVTPS